MWCARDGSDRLGGQVLVINGTATVTTTGRTSSLVGYREKYEQEMRELHRMSLEEFDAVYTTQIRIRPAA